MRTQIKHVGFVRDEHTITNYELVDCKTETFELIYLWPTLAHFNPQNALNIDVFYGEIDKEDIDVEILA